MIKARVDEAELDAIGEQADLVAGLAQQVEQVSVGASAATESDTLAAIDDEKQGSLIATVTHEDAVGAEAFAREGFCLELVGDLRTLLPLIG